MIDWHSHILPKLDDGSKNLDEALELLRILSEQGVNTVIATPHFYANDESLERFLERREESYKSLCEALPENSPKLLLGAEVCYYPGISRLDGLEKLCIEGTRLLLLEMPFEHWTEHTIREVRELAAQVDAYLPRECIMDMAGVTFMDLSGIAVVLKLYRQMNGIGGRTWIENVPPQPMKVLDASGVDRLVKITALV